MHDEDLHRWLTTRPPVVQRLAEEFPPGSRFAVNGETYFLLGYTETDELLVSRTDPAVDYAAACEHREYLCAAHVREGR